MTRNIILAILVFAFILGCAGKTERASNELSDDIQNSKLSSPPEELVQTKSFKEIVKLLPKVQEGTIREKVESILGMPHVTSNRSRGYNVFFYLEIPGGFGTMKAI